MKTVKRKLIVHELCISQGNNNNLHHFYSGRKWDINNSVVRKGAEGNWGTIYKIHCCRIVKDMWKMKFLRKSMNIADCSYFSCVFDSTVLTVIQKNINSLYGIRHHFWTIFLPCFRLISVWKRQISVSSVKSVFLSQEFFELLVNFLYKIFVEVNHSLSRSV